MDDNAGGGKSMSKAHPDSIPRAAITVHDDFGKAGKAGVDTANSPASCVWAGVHPRDDTTEDPIEVPAESSEVDIIFPLIEDEHGGDPNSSSSSNHATTTTPSSHHHYEEENFLHRVGKSLKSLFGCGNKPSPQLDPDLSVAVTCKLDGAQDDSIPLQSVAHSWVTQAAANFPFPVHQSLVIDLPPPLPHPILPGVHLDDQHKMCLVLDLDETLVHSSFLPVPSADYVLSLAMDGAFLHGSHCSQNIYVSKRPGVDAFLDRVTQLFEVVLFTASLSNYADPVIDFLDPTKRIRHRLYREDCVMLQGLYIKDLSRLGRPLDRTAIVDNSPVSYLLQPQCAVAVKSWFNDQDDQELDRLLPALTSLASEHAGVAEWRSTWKHC